uniref:hypothetical protein n=1 Tax=Phaeostrophion irregulare TaxID=243268 RepID=UPI002E75B325|nr:hypothetical protein V2492_pgp041 [Phaeostrophion irregulare]WAM64345.1 hypothetical protein [Phaeostrophion irregulare]
MTISIYDLVETTQSLSNDIKTVDQDLELTTTLIDHNALGILENSSAVIDVGQESLSDRIIADLQFLLYEVYWVEIFLVVSFLVLGFVLDQKFNIKKPRKWFLSCNELIFQRFFAVLAFYVPYIDIMNTLIPQIQITHPFLVRLVMPNFIVDSMEVIQQIPFLSLVYLGFTYGLFIRYRRPKDRFVRFNVMFSIILMSFIGIFQELYYGALETVLKDPSNRAEVSLLLYIVWVALVFYPCFLNAFLGRYTSSYFMREAVEIHLGRDGEDFVWWDRRDKKKKPRKPKK